MRFFVTGATGFIGGHLVRMLVEDGHDVVAVVRSPGKARPLADLGVELAEGDVVERESLRKPMRGVDGVFHLAAWYKVGARDASPAHRVNVEGTRNVLSVMRDEGVRKGVYTSTVAVFSDTRGRVPDEAYRFRGEHLSEYDRTKWLAHHEVAEPMAKAGLPLVILQPGVVYGPGDPSAVGTLFRDWLRGRLPAIPRGTEFCWGHVEDTARAHVVAMEKGEPGESYVVTGPRHSVEDAFAIAERATGRKAPRVRLPGGALRAMAGVMGVVEKVAPVPDAFRAETLRVAAGVTYLGDASKARRELAWAPRPLEEGLPETLRAELAALGMTPRPPH